MAIPPQYFDILGLFTFSVLLYVGIAIRKREKVFSIILIILGAVGLLIDGYNVIVNFILS